MIYFNNRLLLFIIINQLSFINGQICENNNADFFYNVDLTEPVFDQSVYVETLNKSSPIDTTVFTFTVRYKRSNYPSLLSGGTTANITLGNLTVTSDHSSFTVKSNDDGTYRLVTNISPLDYSLPYRRYLFNLLATQNYLNRPSIKSIALVQINLQNFNSHKPIFLPNQIFSISETSQIGTNFGTVYAIDPDNDNIKYGIEDSLQFSINSITGVLQLQQNFQSISPSVHHIIITATDDGSSCIPLSFPCEHLTARTNVTVNVISINKQSPRFSNLVCGRTISFDENKLIDFNVTVYDEDRGDNGIIRIYFPSIESRTKSGLMNKAYSDFYIYDYPQNGISRTASIRSHKSFDYDEFNATRVWNLFILAADNTSQPRTSLCTIRINLNDVNDNRPIFAMSSWNYTIYANSTDKNLFRIIASDADSDNNAPINYYIQTSNVYYFVIDRTTGMIQIRDDVEIAGFDRNRFPIRFQVYAQDRGTPLLLSDGSVNVTIYFDDSGNRPPVQWTDRRYENIQISILEKFYEVNRNLSPISDVNSSFNGSYIYQFTSSIRREMIIKSPFDQYIPFQHILLSNNNGLYSSGIIVTSNLDAEQKNFYLLYTQIPVNPPLISLTSIKLIDQNDQIPTFDIYSLTLHILEDESENRNITQIQAFDSDIDYPNNFVQYHLNEQLSDREAIGKFFVALDGTISTNATFDYESNKTFYQIFITAFDGAPAWYSATNESNTQNLLVNIQIIDVNDEIPDFLNPSITFSINETTEINIGILNLTVIDKDINTKLNFGIFSGNIQNIFTFTFLSDNSSSTEYQAIGQLKIIAPLNYKSNANYTLILFVSDTIHLKTITITIHVLPQNTGAPHFNLMPGFTRYQYVIKENTNSTGLPGRFIEAIDPDNSTEPLVYEIVNNNPHINLNNLRLSNQGNNQIAIVVDLPGLCWNSQENLRIYNFSIRATDERGYGVSSYVPVSITVIDINNHAPIPTDPPWSLYEGVLNPSTKIRFTDFDDPLENNTLPYKVQSLTSQFLVVPTLNNEEMFTISYNGILNRSLTKNLTVTFNTSDNKGYYQITTIPIIVADILNTYSIFDASKTFDIIYVNGYINTLRNIPLGSIFVKDLDDWFRADKIYSITYVSSEQIFSISQGFLSTSGTLNPGSYTIRVDVTKPNVPSKAVGTVNLKVVSIDSEYVRQAATIRIQGEYPETLIDPTLGNRLNTLRDALALFLSVSTDQIQFLAIHSVFQYQNPHYPFDQAKQQALTDVIFYVPSLNRLEIKTKLNANIDQFASRFRIIVNLTEPDPCINYICPTGTTCRVTRTIQSVPYTIDTNETSFVGVNILDSADCVKSTYMINMTIPTDCKSLEKYAPLGPYCEVLGRTFNRDYAVFADTSFSNLAPTRFSFDFLVPDPIHDGLILLYGRNVISINDYFWIAIEIYQSKLRFHFRETILHAISSTIIGSTWYHIEYRYYDSIILVSINDYPYTIMVNGTLNTNDLSSVQLYLGGLPTSGSFISNLYPSLTQVNSFQGCIRNVLSNGYYVDMRKPIVSENSNADLCPCEFTKPCINIRAVGAVSFMGLELIWILLGLVLIDKFEY